MGTTTLRYHQLLGMSVVAADGQVVGRVRDLKAERRGDALAVTALLVGPAALLQRIAFQLPRFSVVPLHPIPWQFVARIDDRIYLRVPKEEVALDTGSAR